MGKVMRFIALSALFAFSIIACASFPYRWYVLNYESGKLQGPQESDDLPLSFCAKGPDYKCIVIETEQFRAFRKDYDDKVERLKSCEKH